MSTISQSASPAPTTTKPEPRPITTWRVMIRDTGAYLRLSDGHGRSFESRPCFGQLAHYIDQLAEFTTEDAAWACIDWLKDSGRHSRYVMLRPEPVAHVINTHGSINSLLQRVTTTAATLALAQWNLEDKTFRGLAGLAPLSQVAEVVS